MAISEFVDGTTPLDASHLNALVGGVNDLTDTGILDKKIVTDSSSNAYITSGQIATLDSADFTVNQYGFLIACAGPNQNALYFWRSGNLTTLMQTGSAIEASLDAKTLTVSMTSNYAAVRYIAIIV